MATIYDFEVHCVSPFVMLSDKKIAGIIEKALSEYLNKDGLRLENIKVEVKK